MRKRGESVPENMTLYFIKHIQLGSVVRVEPRILHMSRRFVKVDFDFFTEDRTRCKSNGYVSAL